MRPWTIAVRDGIAYLEDGEPVPAARCRDLETAERIIAALAPGAGARAVQTCEDCGGQGHLECDAMPRDGQRRR